MYEYDDDEPRRRWAIGLVAILALGGWFGYQRLTGDGGAASGPDGLTFDPPAEPIPSTSSETSIPESSAVETTNAPTPEPSKLLSRPTTRTVTPTTTSSVPRTTTSTSTTTPPTTFTTTAPTTVTTAPIDPGSLLPDGTVVSALVSFDADVISMSGTLTSQRAVDGLLDFVADADATGRPIRNELTINPAAPGADSVRFVGLDPLPYPEGTADILPAHAAELDRIAALIDAYPNITVVVVGRADQRGPAERNLGIAEQRTAATVHYLVGRGLDPARLSAVAIGESQLTSTVEDEEAYALNRRIEFVVYGLGDRPQTVSRR
jgi:outer membrane protein OmpA-like peptidoglycan-associated protein